MPTIYKPKKSTKKREVDTEKKKERQLIYQSTMWKNLRKAKLMMNPICEVCNKNLAEDVHHIDSFMNYQDNERLQKAYDMDNLLSICKKCHGKLHSHNNNHTKKE